MKRTLASLLVAVVFLAGCQNYHQKQYTLKLQDAHEALCEGLPEKADLRLAEAERIATKHKLQQTTDAEILQAESKLAQDDVSEALVQARDILAEVDIQPESRARAEEITGKAALT